MHHDTTVEHCWVFKPNLQTTTVLKLVSSLQLPFPCPKVWQVLLNDLFLHPFTAQKRQRKKDETVGVEVETETRKSEKSVC